MPSGPAPPDAPRIPAGVRAGDPQAGQAVGTVQGPPRAGLHHLCKRFAARAAAHPPGAP
jgi:hypothetical protein